MKKIKYLLLSVIFLINIGNVQAKEMTSDEIENNSYVIGTQIYDGEVTLLTSHIMLAARTIPNNNLEDMIIYYKTPRGKWINGATGENIEVPKKFIIEYKNGELLQKPKYGDVNEDKAVNTDDVIIIRKYLAGSEIPGNVNLTNADVNGDSKITEADLVLLKKFLSGNYPDAKLPEEPLGKSYIIEYLLVNNNSSTEVYSVDYELNDAVLYDGQKPDDPSKEGYVFEGWYLDENYTTKFEFDNMKITSNITLFAKFKELRYGDVNEDDEINSVDVTLLRRYLAGYDISKSINLTNADVNGDLKINDADVALLRKYLAGYYPNAKLPEEPLGKTYIINYVIDNISSIDTYYTDYELEGKVLYGPPTNVNPTKEGYVFEGWYLDENYTTKFEFDNTEITSNIILFAKFKELRYGDVNDDGFLNISDVILLKNYLTGYEIPENINLTNADINGDEKITEADLVVYRKYLAGNYPDAKLPEEPLGKTYYIEYVIDNISSIDTYYKDYELENEVLYDTQKPTNPTKEGYVFEGWYLDENYTTKFEFDNTKITSNMLLFAKFVEN